MNTLKHKLLSTGFLGIYLLTLFAPSISYARRTVLLENMEEFEIPKTIRVRVTTGKNPGIRVVPFKEYVRDSLPKEWIMSWPMESLKVGAMLVKNYAIYRIYNKKHRPYRGIAFDILDNTADQRYVPGSGRGNPRVEEAINSTWDTLVLKDSKIKELQYDSGRKGHLAPLYRGRLSQWGSASLASQGKSFKQILNYYYRGLSFYELKDDGKPDVESFGDMLSDDEPGSLNPKVGERPKPSTVSVTSNPSNPDGSMKFSDHVAHALKYLFSPGAAQTQGAKAVSGI